MYSPSGHPRWIHFVFLIFVFLPLKMPVAIDLHFINQQGAQLQLKIICTVLLRKKSQILDGLRVSKLTTHYTF